MKRAAGTTTAAESKKAKPEEQKTGERSKDDKRFVAARKVQEKIAALDDKFNNEVKALRVKYDKQQQPHYVERSAALKSVDDFWADVFKKAVYQLFGSQDEEDAIESLTEIALECTEPGKSKLTLTFKENDFFKNTTIVRTERLPSGTDDDKDSGSAECTPIEWKSEDLSKIESSVPGEPGFFSWLCGSQIDEEVSSSINAVWQEPMDVYLDEELNDMMEGEFDECEDDDEEGDDEDDE